MHQPFRRNHPSAKSGSVYAVLAATTRKILEEKDISKTLRTLCQEACRILGAERALVVTLQEDGKESAWKILEPWPVTIKGGVPPTALKARTGLLTPPGRYRWASSKSSRERLKFIGNSLFCLQPLCKFLGMIGDDNVSPSSLDGS